MVNAHAVTLFEPVFSYVKLIAVPGGEHWRFGVVLLVEDVSEEMVLELYDEVLVGRERKLVGN